MAKRRAPHRRPKPAPMWADLAALCGSSALASLPHGVALALGERMGRLAGATLRRKRRRMIEVTARCQNTRHSGHNSIPRTRNIKNFQTQNLSPDGRIS